MQKFFLDYDFQFIDMRRYGFIVSLILIVIGIGSLVIHKGPAFGIDFTGGTLIELKFEEKVDIQKIRDVLKGMDLGDSIIQMMGNENQVMIRTPNRDVDDEAKIGELIEETGRASCRERV